MRNYLFFAVMLLASTSTASAQTLTLKPELSGIAFLLGNWTSASGTVYDTNSTSRGTSHIAPAAGGAVVLREDHTDVLGTNGKPSQSFDQIMMVYPENGTLRADYSDGTHVIHYVSAEVVPGRSVTFTTALRSDAPSFRLSYDKTSPNTLSVRFEMAAPGQTTFHPIATGTLRKSI
jgi:hypothetical protein